MNDTSQNLELEMQAPLALKAENYDWTKTPISDVETARDAGFEIARPLEEFRREALATMKKRDDVLLVDPHTPARAFVGAGPGKPYSAPSRIVLYTEGEHLVERLEPRTDKGPLAGLSENQFVNAAMRLYDRLDEKKRRWWKDQLSAIAGPTKSRSGRDRDERVQHGPNRVAGLRRQDREQDEEAEEREKRVGSDRNAAFDAETDALMPLNDEGLYKWHGWLPRKLEVNGDAWRAWCGLKSFLQRGLLQKKFGELTWGEKLVLRAAVRKMVEAQS